MQLADFDYDLPQSLIAQEPPEQRGASRLLCLDGANGALHDRRFADICDLLHAGDLLVLNDTRVIPARLTGHKASGGRCEVLIERVIDGDGATALVRASKTPRTGTRLIFQGCQAVVEGRDGDLYRLRFDHAVMDCLAKEGHVPLPPYIQRADQALDRERYQTVYADRPGAVAAPTAGLHFDQAMLDRLVEQGVEQARLTLHVGAGTFQPVRTADIREHRMHAERVEVSEKVCEAVRRTRQRGGRVVAVGTTVVRSLESAAEGGELRSMSGETSLFIYPGYRFRVVDAMLTNFHLPRSSLLMLVSAFAGRAAVLAAYRHAVDNRYRFFSYGDAMFLTPEPATGNNHEI
ncbi:MAG: tRNA preQ1(34) S-adenosylmethionine ribosyltransferase-isomerase QueA [Gammaproteobacteria bacterium]|nr:tRNA preQ1(34) S-adenosylmethionine ribosyltransferase-isomerase QueA [Gammaproteobacteria bacterium]MCZ6880456.1 tRNA preQ1(34) S-adenosylmethionine ribosyltransferase-isomerase QueA [Gammaproteobacteria bacterium]